MKNKTNFFSLELKEISQKIKELKSHKYEKDYWKHQCYIPSLKRRATCFHILYNTVRNKPQHCRNEEQYVNTWEYKTILQEYEDSIKIQQETKQIQTGVENV